MSAPATASVRMIWFDACRVFAALGVVLIHSTTDQHGQPFSAASTAERFFPAAVRGIAEFSSSELFIVFSLFLLAMKLDRRDDGFAATLAAQLQRLAVPFLAWTAFYAVFRLFKAHAFGYGAAIEAQLADPLAWLGFVLLGDAQYHLHFIPELLCILLFYPLMRGAVTYPVLGLMVVPSLAILELVQGHIWNSFSDPVVRAYVLRSFKIVSYVGYGFAAFALFGLWKRGLDGETARQVRNAAAYACLILILGTVSYIVGVAQAGQWIIRPFEAYMGHAILPVAMFALFMGMKDGRWSPRFTHVARFTFGVYLTHPIAIDAFDILASAAAPDLAPWVMVTTKWMICAPAAFGMAYLLGRFPPTAWLVGLGPVPFAAKRREQVA